MRFPEPSLEVATPTRATCTVDTGTEDSLWRKMRPDTESSWLVVYTGSLLSRSIWTSICEEAGRLSRENMETSYLILATGGWSQMI